MYSICFVIKNYSEFNPYVNKHEFLKYELNVRIIKKNPIGHKFVD